jgi:membrane-bound ClpP family serine protease
MNLVSRTITGGVLIIIGLILIVISPFTVFTTLIYGIPILIIGLIIFLNKKEDKIEERKDLNKIKNKK